MIFLWGHSSILHPHMHSVYSLTTGLCMLASCPVLIKPREHDIGYILMTDLFPFIVLCCLCGCIILYDIYICVCVWCVVCCVSDNWDVLTKLSMSHYLLAVDYFNDSKFLSCYEQVDGAIQLYNDKVPEYYALRGKSAYFQGLYHEAYLDFKIVLEKNPENVEILKYMRQFETPPEKETDTTADLFVGVSGKQKPEKERNLTRNFVENMHKSPSTSHGIQKVKVKPSDVPIVNDPLGVNTDYERLAQWNTQADGREKNLNEPMHISKCTAMLPDVNPYLAASVVYHEAAKPRMNELNQAVHSRTNVEESALWELIRDAETQGRRMRYPKNEKNVGLTESEILARKTRKIPPSSTGTGRGRTSCLLTHPAIQLLLTIHAYIDINYHTP